MSLNEKDIENIARLARIEISASEAKNTSTQLNEILELIKTMQAVDTDHVDTMSHPINYKLRLREDTEQITDIKSVAMDNAPETDSGLFLVPKVID